MRQETYGLGAPVSKLVLPMRDIAMKCFLGCVSLSILDSGEALADLHSRELNRTFGLFPAGVTVSCRYIVPSNS